MKKNKKVTFIDDKKRLIVIGLLFLILSIGIFLRLQGVVTNSFAFTYDVGRDLLAVNNIVKTHELPLIGFTTGVEGIFYGPWWYYILTLPFIVSGGNPQFIVFFIACTGILTIFLGYFIGKKIGGRFLGLTFAVLMSVSPVLIGISSQIWNPNVAPLFVMITFFVLYKIFTDNSIKPITGIFLGVLLGLIIDSEIVFGLLLFSGYIISLVIILRKQVFKLGSLFVPLGLLIIFSPRIFFELRHHFIMTSTILHMITNRTGSAGKPFIESVLAKLVIFHNLFTDTIVNHYMLLSFLIIIFCFVILIKFFKKINQVERNFLILSLIVVFCFIIGIGLFSHDIWSHYLVGLPVFYILVVSIVFQLIRNNITYGTYITLAALCILVWINLKPIQLIQDLQKPLWEGDASVYRNQLAVIDYIYHSAHNQKFNYVVYTPPVHDYTYQYLFNWYGTKKYGYVPSKATDKAKLFFLIIEPDTSHPFYITDWLNVRKNDGKIQSEKVIKGGITVQTRYH